MAYKYLLAAMIGLLAMPASAQQTGPGGLAEPKVRGMVEAVIPPAPPALPENMLNLQLSSGGIVTVLLRPDKAPLSVAQVKALAARHFYDGLSFHRVIDGFMAQGGDPKGDGSGGSDLPNLKAEFNDLPHVRGAMAMARAESPDSANSQFYLMLSPNLQLDGRYTVIGRVIAGMAYVDQLPKGEPPANPGRIVRAYFGLAPSATDAATPAVATTPTAVPRTLANVPTTLATTPGTASTPAPKAPKPPTKKPAPRR